MDVSGSYDQISCQALTHVSKFCNLCGHAVQHSKALFQVALYLSSISSIIFCKGVYASYISNTNTYFLKLCAANQVNSF